ncbi:MAG: lysylphosphatidylglycerol synthase transmembrane domain-containing protein [Cyanobacteria bacterium]|nr:lysylphosphatidylglycerol synthase transmembrane domain-containing protein [Cyanobacteriota bacterium]
MNKKLALIIKLAVSILLVVILIKVADLDLKKTFIAIKETDLKWFIICTMMFTATTFTNAYRWWVLARLLNYELSFFKAIRMYFEAMFANNFLPSNFGGDAIRAYDLGRNDKTWLRAASTILTERFFGFVMMFCMIPIGLVFMQFSPIGQQVPNEVKLALLVAFGGLVIALASYQLWSKIPWNIVQKFNYAVHEYTRCTKSLKQVVFWTFMTHMFLLAGNVCSAYALGVSLSEIPAWYWLIMTPAATLISFVVPAVKGVGAKEASYIYFLGYLGITSDKGLAIGFIAFVATLIASLPGISIAFKKIKINKVIEEEKLHEAEELKKVK